MVRILLVDDHAVVRRGLRQIIADEPDWAEAAEAACAAQALQLLRAHCWDVVVLDISLPDGNGLDLLRELKAEQPALPVLMLSMHAEEQFARQARKLGAAGYLTKESAPEELVCALRMVLSGGAYFSAPPIESASPAAALGKLSAREFQVLSCLAAGQSIGEISAALALSNKTVSTYRKRLLLKLKLKSNAELALFAVQHGLLG